MVWRQLLAEVQGTATLAFVAFASSGNALAVAAGLLIIIIGTGMIGGAHFNPVATTAVLIKKKLTNTLSDKEWNEYKWYFLAQIVGGFIGSAFGVAITDSHFGFKVQSGSTKIEAFIAEAVFSAHFALMVIMSGEFIDSKVMSVGVLTFTLFVAISTVGYISGGCFNPAVCLTVDIVKFIYFGEEDYVKDIWIFILAPMIGSVFGALISLIYLGDKKFKAVDASD